MDNLGIPSGEYFDARLSVCGNLPVQLRLDPGNPVQPLYLEDPMRMFSGVSSASASARLAFPTLFLSPIPNGRNYCLHDGDDDVSFRAILHPMDWADNFSFATISGFALQDDGTLWLQAPNPRAPMASSTGSVAFHTPWLYHGELAESATIHWCAGEGAYCYACGHVHSDLNSCSHDTNCAAKSGLEAECDCTPIFVRVNFNDDDLDGMEDRYDRENPYLIRLRNECAVNEGGLSLALANNPSYNPIPYLCTTGDDILFPGETTNRPPFCIKNNSSTFYLDTLLSGNVTASLTYSLDFEGCHAPIHDTLNIQVVDIDLPDYVVRTNEVGSIVYDYSHVGTTITWLLYDVGLSQYIDTHTGSTYTPPANLLNGDYRVEAHFSDVFEGGSTSAFRTASLYVCPIVLEPITIEKDTSGYNYNPASVLKWECGKFKIEVGDIAHIPDADVVWTGEAVRFENNQNTGRIVEVIPTTAGSHTLTVSIRNHFGPPPTITFHCFNNYASIPVHFTVICENDGTLPTDVQSPYAFATNLVEHANQVFRQACVSLYVDENISFVRNSDWYSLDRDLPVSFAMFTDEIFYSTSPTNGLKVYVVDSFTHGTSLDYYAITHKINNTSYGSIVPAYIDFVTFAHELCHGCGLDDIYATNDNLVEATNVLTISGMLSPEDVSLDGTGSGFYYTDALDREVLISRLLMWGNPPIDDLQNHTDLPRGKVYGLRTDDYQHFYFGRVAVGLSDLIRTPQTLGRTDE